MVKEKFVITYGEERDNMPFRKITRGEDAGKYKSQYGKIYTLKQLRAYYATKGWKRKVKKK